MRGEGRRGQEPQTRSWSRHRYAGKAGLPHSMPIMYAGKVLDSIDRIPQAGPRKPQEGLLSPTRKS